ncbi:MAG: hypothetical protein QOF57_1298, partial [Frankiaceae bacterium]|nr:hypothetical protein [Frankiaceae bacterium]
MTNIIGTTPADSLPEPLGDAPDDAPVAATDDAPA